jgi:hypothetical protein
MLQNRINITYTAAELTAFDDALTVIEDLLDRVPNLSAEERSRVAKMPDGAWGFILNLRTLAQQNIQKLPREYEDSIIATDIASRDALAVRLNRIAALHDRADLGLMLTESDCWAGGRYIRSHLMDGGLGPSIEALLDDGMRRYFSRSNSEPAPPPPAPPAPTP